MIKVRIQIPGQPESIVTVEGDEAVIGRNPACDVVLPVPYVSQEHAKIVTGVAVADMASTNGVWVEGKQLTGVGVLRSSVFHLGATPETSPSVEVLEVSAGLGADAGVMEQLHVELEGLRERNLQLEQELQRLRAELQSQAFQQEDGDDATLLAPMAAKEPKTEPVPVAPEPNPTPDPAPGGTPSFASFFDVAPTPAPVPAVVPEPRSATAPSVPAAASAAPSARDRAGVLEMIDNLIRDDVGEHLPIIQGPVEQFFTLESFRLLRQVERVITRLAREFKQLYDMTTMLPDSGGNFRSLAAEVLLDPDNAQQRQELVDYLDELRRWLGVSLAANRKAAQRFVLDLKKDLSAEGLVLDEPIPGWMKAIGKDNAEYWRRVQVYLKALDEETIEDRLEKYAKEFAIEVMEGNQGSRDSLYH